MREPVLTRRHTEELLARCGAPLTEDDRRGGARRPPPALDAGALRARRPRRPVAGRLLGGGGLSSCPAARSPSNASTSGAGRRGFLDVLARMGADIDEVPATGPGDLAATADVVARFGPLQATEVHAAEITGLDEVPVLAVAAACASGDTVFRDVGELRVKESDRLAGVAGLVGGVRGPGRGRRGRPHRPRRRPTSSPVRSTPDGDHRMAMAARRGRPGGGHRAQPHRGVGRRRHQLPPVRRRPGRH